MTAFLALAAVFAGVFVFAALDHDCVGEHCTVCPQAETSRRLIESLWRAAAIALPAACAAMCAANPAKRFILPYSFQLTPVSLKIKSNS